MIHIVNTNQHNLKGVTLAIPNNKLIVVTGVSGSGKSTLIYNVLFQEARRRYLESFSANTRQLLGKIGQANYDYLAGLSPAIALEQGQKISSPRSTVGTLTEIYDLLRLLFARYGETEDKELVVNKNLFSFNNPTGACASCKGIGIRDVISKKRLIKDESKSLSNGAVATTTPTGYIMYSQITLDVLAEVCEAEGFSVDTPWKDLTKEQQDIFWYGSNKIKVPFGKHTLESRMKWTGITAKPRDEGYYKGLIPIMDEILNRDRNPSILRFTESQLCDNCQGHRLNKKALSVLYKQHSIDYYSSQPISEFSKSISQLLELSTNEGEKSILFEIDKTIETILKLGLGYLHLNKSSEKLTGGETQRLRMAKLVNSNLRGMIYVFDEPSIGMHPTEVKNLLDILQRLKNNGNTVFVVEHNHLVINNAEWIIDIGENAGKNGGKVLYNGSLGQFLEQGDNLKSKTLAYLKRDVLIVEDERAELDFIQFESFKSGIFKHTNVNLVKQGINIVTGKTGVGKSELIKTISKHFVDRKEGKANTASICKKITGDDFIKRVEIIDQSPIGKTPRSNPATYTGLSDELRKLYAKTPEAKANNLSNSHFSFNTKSGRCSNCEGAGYLQLGMHTLGVLETICDVCNGKQFDRNVLGVKYQGKSLADVYSMDIGEAKDFFENEPAVYKYLKVLHDLGLSYLKLNQRSSTLSGGEARRVKLAKELVKSKTVNTLYVIDEPSTGLHGYDIDVLVRSLRELTKLGHTIILSEQNPIFIQQADWVIELERDNNSIVKTIESSAIDYYTAKKEMYVEALLAKKDDKEQRQNIAKPITFQNVRTNNLKGFDIDIPVNKLTVVTGVSGSGKSSLIFDTLFSEGRQKFAECFSSYVRSRINLNSKAKYDNATGLFPTIAIDQKNYAKSERSTVGTMTDIYSQLRLLFARVGKSDRDDDQVISSHFSFNHEHGACPACEGLGYQLVPDADKFVSNPELSIAEGAMNGSKPGKFFADVHGQYYATLQTVAAELNIDLDKNWNEFTEAEKDLILKGTDEKEYQVNWNYKRNNREGSHNFVSNWPGFVHLIGDDYLKKINGKQVGSFTSILKKIACNSCNGKRLNNRALSYKVSGKTIDYLCDLPITDLIYFFRVLLQNANDIDVDPLKQRAAFIISGALMRGLDMLEKLGLDYLSLNRRANTLSGGEGQRVRLASSLVHDLSGVCYVLDEPTLGLHQKDTHHLIILIKDLIGQGNTVMVSEHDPYFIKNADHIIELGPLAGKNGGELKAQGSFNDIMNNKSTLSSKYLDATYSFNRDKIDITDANKISIRGAQANNLKQINLEIPTNCLVGIHGVSGSGKSSLVRQVIYQSYVNANATNCSSIEGLSQFNDVFWVNQQTIKAGSQSYIASFLGIYDILKKPFLQVIKEGKTGLLPKHFALNGKEGCCPNCKGKGYISTSLDFLSNVDEICETCNGKLFNDEVLKVKWQGNTISDILNLSLGDLSKLYKNRIIERVSSFASKIGLDYLLVGQIMKNLSGGELQRLKLLQTIMDDKNSNSLFLFDEPTMGLHLKDVESLLEAFNLLLSEGNSIVFIEHNEHLLRSADFTIELGPGAGDKGGTLIKQLAQN